MKKKITLFLAFASLFNATCLYTAQAPFHHPVEISHEVADGKLMISYAQEGSKTELFSLDQKPFGEEAGDLTLDTLLRSAHKSMSAFSFLLCNTQNNTQVIVLTDSNLHPICDVPEELSPVGKYKLYAGGKGTCFPPNFTRVPTQPSVVVQEVHIPYAVPVEILTPYAVPVYLPAFPFQRKARRKKRVHAPRVAALEQHEEERTHTEETSVQLGEVEKRAAEEQAAQEAQRIETLRMQEEQTKQEVAQRAAVAAQETLAQEQHQEREKVQAKEAVKEARLKRQEEEKKRHQLKKDQDTKREEQKQRDKDADAAKKAEEELKKKEREAEKKQPQEKKSAPGSVAAAVASSHTHKKGKPKDNDDALLEKEMARVAALRAALPPQQPSAAATGTSAKTRVLSKSNDYHLAENPSLFLKHWQTFPPVATSSHPAPATASTPWMKGIKKCLEGKNYVAALELLRTLPSAPTPECTAFWVEVYVHEKHHLTSLEIEELIRHSQEYAKDKTVSKTARCGFYSALAIHATDLDEKEEYIQKGLTLDEVCPYFLQIKAIEDMLRALKIEKNNPVCKQRDEAGCAYSRVDFRVKALQAERIDCYEGLFLEMLVLVKALSGTCSHVKSILDNSGIDPRTQLIHLYTTRIRQRSGYSQQQLEHINNLIPANVIPKEQLRHIADSN